MRTEVAILHKMSHPNVVGFVNWYESRNHLWMIVEYCAGGSLRDLLASDGLVPEHLIITMGVDIMAGMAYLHSRSCLLRDVKPKNFLLTEYGAVKARAAPPLPRNGALTPCPCPLRAQVGDVGVACPVPTTRPEAAQANTVGTPAYLAPELFANGAVPSIASDMWGLGCVLFEMAFGRTPFWSDSLKELVHSVRLVPGPAALRCSRTRTDHARPASTPADRLGRRTGEGAHRSHRPGAGRGGRAIRVPAVPRPPTPSAPQGPAQAADLVRRPGEAGRGRIGARLLPRSCASLTLAPAPPCPAFCCTGYSC